jgi:hypothetical protein
MANRPQVPNWNNINLNKPEEYSSEYVVDGNRYANVTNVTTGQRQLYYVQPLSGQRGLLTTTNADGTVAKGPQYNNFIQFQGQSKLNNAEINNKKQSNFIIGKASTPEEKSTIGKTTQYKSSIGNTAAQGGGGSPTQSGAVGDNPQSKPISQDELLKQEGLKDGGSRTNYRKDLRYPLTRLDDQDYIKFTMYKYTPRKVSSGSESTLGSDELSKDRQKEILGKVTLPIQPSISDNNTVTWNEDELNAIAAEGAGLSIATMLGGAAGAEQQLGEAGQVLQNNADTIKAQLVTSAAAAAVGTNSRLFTRVTGAITNPNLELLFKGPNLRSFSYTFSMSARDEEEARVIREIIRFFKQGMSVKRAKSSLYLKSPNIFGISYVYGGNNKDHPWLNKIKDCALTGCGVNYTPAGNYATYEDGSMTQYDLSLTFSELDPIYDDDYAEADSAVGGGLDSSIGY